MKIKPCPFCGEIPAILPLNPKIEGDAWAAVKCDNLECHARPRVEDGIHIAGDRGSLQYMEAAVRRWNIRK